MRVVEGGTKTMTTGKRKGEGQDEEGEMRVERGVKGAQAKGNTEGKVTEVKKDKGRVEGEAEGGNEVLSNREAKRRAKKQRLMARGESEGDKTRHDEKGEAVADFTAESAAT